MLMCKLSAAIFELHLPDVQAVRRWLVVQKHMPHKDVEALWTDNQRWWHKHSSIRKSIPAPGPLEERLNAVMMWVCHTETAGHGMQPLPVQQLLHVHNNQLKLVRDGLVSGKLHVPMML